VPSPPASPVVSESGGEASLGAEHSPLPPAAAAAAPAAASPPPAEHIDEAVPGESALEEVVTVGVPRELRVDDEHAPMPRLPTRGKLADALAAGAPVPAGAVTGGDGTAPALPTSREGTAGTGSKLHRNRGPLPRASSHARNAAAVTSSAAASDAL
jgi:hypothetical protein